VLFYGFYFFDFTMKDAPLVGGTFMRDHGPPFSERRAFSVTFHVVERRLSRSLTGSFLTAFPVLNSHFPLFCGRRLSIRTGPFLEALPRFPFVHFYSKDIFSVHV